MSEPTRDEYTPTTDEVRDSAGQGAIALEPEEFDRWLAETVRAAKAEAFNEGWVERAKRDSLRINSRLDPADCPRGLNPYKPKEDHHVDQ